MHPEKHTQQHKQSYEGQKTGLPEHETRKLQTKVTEGERYKYTILNFISHMTLWCMINNHNI